MLIGQLLTSGPPDSQGPVSLLQQVLSFLESADPEIQDSLRHILLQVLSQEEYLHRTELLEQLMAPALQDQLLNLCLSDQKYPQDTAAFLIENMMQHSLKVPLLSHLSQMVAYLPSGPSALVKKHLLHILVETIKLNDAQTNAALVEEGLGVAAVGLLVQHPWNNILHCQVHRLLMHMLSGEDQSLKDHVMCAEVQESLLRGVQQQKGDSQRQGYMGYVIKIGLLMKFCVLEHGGQWSLSQGLEVFLKEAYERENVDFTQKGEQQPQSLETKESIVLPSPPSEQKDFDADISNKFNPSLHSQEEEFVQNNFWKLGVSQSKESQILQQYFSQE